MAKIRVTAGPGRLVPIPVGIYTEPGSGLCYLGSNQDDDQTLHARATRTEIEIDESHHFVQRSLRNGDLVRVQTKVAAAVTPPAKE